MVISKMQNLIAIFLTIITTLYILQIVTSIGLLTLFPEDLINDHIQYNKRNNSKHSIYYWLIPVIPFVIIFIRNFKNALNKLKEIEK